MPTVAPGCDVGLVEQPPDEQQARPRAGGHDHGPVAAGQVERLALRARLDEVEHAGGDEQHGGLDEREDLKRRARSVTRPGAGRSAKNDFPYHGRISVSASAAAAAGQLHLGAGEGPGVGGPASTDPGRLGPRRRVLARGLDQSRSDVLGSLDLAARARPRAARGTSRSARAGPAAGRAAPRRAGARARAARRRAASSSASSAPRSGAGPRRGRARRPAARWRRGRSAASSAWRCASSTSRSAAACASSRCARTARARRGRRQAKRTTSAPSSSAAPAGAARRARAADDGALAPVDAHDQLVADLLERHVALARRTARRADLALAVVERELLRQPDVQQPRRRPPVEQRAPSRSSIASPTTSASK